MPADPTTEYILGELTRRLNEIAERLEAGLSRMDGVYARRETIEGLQNSAKLEHANMLQNCLQQSEAGKSLLAELTRRVDESEEGRLYLKRLVSGSAVTAVFGVIVAIISARHGL